MLVGVVSDSHDNLVAIVRVIQFLNERKVGFVIHAGDFVAPFSLKPFGDLRCPWIGVFGNNDGDQKALTRESKGRIQPGPYELNLDGKKVVVVHDLASSNKDEFVRKGAQVVVSGHTHEPKVEKGEKTIFVNPGELCGWISGHHTVALFDTSNQTATIEQIPMV